MAERSAHLFRELIDAFNAGGVEASLLRLHPEIEWHAPPEWLEQRVYRGRDGVRELGTYWTQHFDDYHLDLARVIELDDGRAVGLLHQRGRIKQSGAEVEQPVGYLCEFRDGMPVRIDVYFTWQETLEAAELDPHLIG